MALLEAKWAPSPTDLRVFGVGAGALAPALAWWWGAQPLDPWLAGGGAFALLALVAPPVARPPYLLLLVLTAPLRWLLSHLLLGLVYFGLVTPVGLLLRLSGREVMGRPDASLPTYWVPREGAPEPASYFRRF